MDRKSVGIHMLSCRIQPFRKIDRRPLADSGETKEQFRKIDRKAFGRLE
jgi:hypothetical protein